MFLHGRLPAVRAEQEASARGVVAVDAGGRLIAYAGAVPPDWVRTAAGAELWSIIALLTEAPCPPPMATDCFSVLAAAAAGTATAAHPSRTLAHLWSRVATVLDGDITVLAAGGRLTWMPAHTSQAAVGARVRSDGRLVSSTDWRASRLADAVAKDGAAGTPLSRQLQLLSPR